MLGATKYCWQLEAGESGTPHIQGILYFKNPRTFESLKNSCPEVHWEVARSLKACIEYCSKVDTRIGPTKTKGFELPEVVETIHEEDLEEWQAELLSVLDAPPLKRTIYWLWEEVGGVGKTEFCKFLCIHRDDVLYLNGKASDMKYAVAKFIEMHKRGPKVILCDFPRSYQPFVSYMGLEELKNGIFFSGKYESCQCIYNTPHVVCFANFPPNLGSLSSDRWNVVHLEFDET
jgi:hypothetical protein